MIQDDKDYSKLKTPEIPNKMTYAEQLKQIEESVAAVKKRTAEVLPLVAKKVATFEPLDIGEAVGARGKINEDEYAAFSVAGEANGATDRIVAATGKLEVPTEVPEYLEPPGYLVSKELQEGWQDTAKRLQELATYEPEEREAKIRAEYEAAGIPEGMEMLQSLTTQAMSVRQQLDIEVAAKAQGLLAIDQRMAGRVGVIARGEKARYEQQANSRISALAATVASYASQAQMLRNNIVLAQSIANNIVDASTYDSELEWKTMTDLYDLQYDFIQDLTDAEKDILDEQRDYYEAIYKEQKAEREDIVGWATKKATAAALYGVDLSTISYEDAADRVRDYLTMKGIAEEDEDVLTLAQTRTDVQGTLDNLATRLNSLSSKEQEELLASMKSGFRKYLVRTEVVSWATGLPTKQWKALKVGYTEAEGLYGLPLTIEEPEAPEVPTTGVPSIFGLPTWTEISPEGFEWDLTY